MTISEQKIREITREAQRVLGPTAQPEMVKKVVREVVRRLIQEQKGSPK